MGSAVSAGHNNEELTDNLWDAEYIRTPKIDRLFRAVDRGEYILPEDRTNAYKDQAWRRNHLHLSAPCIYSEVLEGLAMGPGMSFLNLGSGTGYLSTLAGLILGGGGINHGVEYYDDVIAYANAKLETFKRHSGAMDAFDFCEPKFMQGNCLCITSDRRYDRVYVGAACPSLYDGYMKNLVKVGGILVMPFHDQLLKVRRDTECSWVTVPLLPVSFAMLIMPPAQTKEEITLMDIQPKSLQCLCRCKIRNILRNNVDVEHPDLSRPVEREKKILAPRRKPGIGPVLVLDPDLPSVRRRAQRRNTTGSNSSSSSSSDSSSTSSSNSEPEYHHPGRDGTTAYAEADSTQPDFEPCPVNSVTVDEVVRVTPENGVPHRRKFDSGLGDDESNHDDDEPMSVEPDRYNTGIGLSKRTKLTWFNKWLRPEDRGNASSSSSDPPQPPIEEVQRAERVEMLERAMVLEEAIYNDDDSDDEDIDEGGENDDTVSREDAVFDMEVYKQRRTVDSPYTELMSNKINALPLPPTLKNYLNFYRF